MKHTEVTRTPHRVATRFLRIEFCDDDYKSSLCDNPGGSFALSGSRDHWTSPGNGVQLHGPRAMRYFPIPSGSCAYLVRVTPLPAADGWIIFPPHERSTSTAYEGRL